MRAGDGPSLERLLDRIAGLGILALLLLGTVLVLRPFFSPLLWGVVLAFSTWPAYARLERWCGRRRGLAALFMTLGLAVAFVLPLVLVGVSLAGNARELAEEVVALLERGLPEPPAWLAALPLVGGLLAESWRAVATDPERLLPFLQPLLGPLRDLALAGGAVIGTGLVQMITAVLMAYFFYRDGAALGRRVRRLAGRVAGPSADHYFEVAQTTLRGVVYGTVGTAIVQAALAVVGFLIAGVPTAFLLGFLTFLLALFPVGAPLVWLPVALWLFHAGGWPWGVFMLLWGGLVVSGSDNIVRPWLISRGSKLPFLLVFVGVIGGVVAFGFLGIFLGPTLLALAVALVREWSGDGPAEGPAG